MKRLTAEIIKKLKPADVIYAEVANPGAMGNAGGVIFYVFQNNEFTTYETNCFKNENEFTKSFLFLKQHENEFVQMDGGFGNMVFAQVGSQLEVNAAHESLIYEHGGKRFDILTSVVGVYNHIYETIEELTNLAKEDCQKYRELNDELVNSEYLTIRVSDYKKAISYIRYKNWLGYGFPEEFLQEGKWSLFKYHMRYAEDKLGRVKFVLAAGEALVQNCVKGLGWAEMTAGMDKAYEILEDLLGENLREMFYGFVTVEQKKLDFSRLFRYPQLVKFSAKAEKELAQRIMHEKWFSPYITGCYFRNYFEQLEILPLDKVLPVVIHVMQHENTDAEMVAEAGDLLNQAWIFSPDDGDFEKTIYEAVKPQIDTWPVKHYDEIHFKMRGRQEIFDDMLGWLGYMHKLNKIDAKMYRAMESWRVDHARDLSWWKLVSPETVPEAEKVCTELLDGKVENPEGAAERLLLNHSPEKVKLYILNFYIDNFDKLQELLAKVPDMMEALYEAACEGVTHRSEVTLLKKFAEKVGAVPPHSEEVIKRNLKIARLQNKAMKGWRN
ncbi:hypothetical protein IJG66_01535 [Candidatus Saccharibacteria bacterium]|nr:hypothetical protein [Candidatus Saccharibacteria bacterium]